ncbi:MAG: AEC family transporter [Firmicutes bacterium]|nr:AEC family transporter [Bacillota bacterium]
MLENFMFSVNVSLPIFVLMFLGFYLRKKEMLTESFISSANTLIFQVALPAKLILDTAKTDFTQSFDWKFLLLSIGGTLLFFGLFWWIGAKVIKEPRKVGAFVHGAVRGNYVYIGFALIQNILGTATLPGEAMLASAFILPLYNILAVIVLTITNHPGEKVDLKTVLKQIITNPMILGVLIGLPFSFLCTFTDFEIPFAVDKSLSYLGNLTTPLALIVIGANTKITSIANNMKSIIMACIFRLILQPLVIVPLAMLMGLGSHAILVLFVLFGVPAAANVYIVTKKMGGDADLGAGIIVVGVLMSLFTLTAGVFILRTLGIV